MSLVLKIYVYEEVADLFYSSLWDYSDIVDLSMYIAFVNLLLSCLKLFSPHIQIIVSQM